MRFVTLAAMVLAVLATPAKSAVFTPYNNQAAFQAALDVSFTRIDYDDAGFFTALGPGVGVGPNDPRFLPFGLEVISSTPGFTNFLVSATNYPAAIGGPTWAQFNGNSTSNTADDFAVNFVGGVNGFGYAPNRIDRGHIHFYSGEDLGGALLGSVLNDGSGAFVGATSDMPIRSAQITCEHDGDFVCGITDPQFGRASFGVPVPATLAIAGVGLAGLMLRSRQRP